MHERANLNPLALARVSAMLATLWMGAVANSQEPGVAPKVKSDTAKDLISNVKQLGVEKLQPLDRPLPNQLGVVDFRQDSSLRSVPLMPAPEVVRLWAPETLASVKLSNSILTAVAELDSREYARREAASAKLLAPQVTPEEIFALLVRGDLSDEQCERLLSIAQAKVLGLPRGALGLRMQPSGDPLHPGVEVIMLLPGMPAERFLKLGDRVESIDSRPIGTSNDLVEIVQSKLPGESVRIAIARPQRDERGRPKLNPDGASVEDPMVFDVPLTSASDLEKFEDRFPTQSRSVIVERRLLALREADERFAPSVKQMKTLPIPDRQIRKPVPAPAPDPVP